VIAAFPGAHLTKTRPAVVLSTPEYHKERPDVILGLITSKRSDVLCSTDYEIQDWQFAGLHAATLPLPRHRRGGSINIRLRLRAVSLTVRKFRV